jgi:hypothetical protein
MWADAVWCRCKERKTGKQGATILYASRLIWNEAQGGFCQGRRY